MNYFFKIAHETVEVQYDNIVITDYLDNDFCFLKCKPEKPSIVICVIEEDASYQHLFNSSNIIFVSAEQRVLQSFKAFQRHFWIEYSIKDGTLYIKLEIPKYKAIQIRRFISPYFEVPIRSCLIDFFHDPFMIVLQYKMMKRNMSLFHASSFIQSATNDMVILSGGAQSGKSSLMAGISKRNRIKICSEDFAFVGIDNRIYGYPHQTRVKFKDMKNLHLEYGKGDGFFKGMQDNVNHIVYGVISNRENGRRFPLKQIFKNHDFILYGEIKNKVYLINRESTKLNNKSISIDEFCKIHTNIIMNEFENMTNSSKLLSSLGKLYGEEWSVINLWYQIYHIYQLTFKDINLRQIELPYYPDIDQAVIELENIIK